MSYYNDNNNNYGNDGYSNSGHNNNNGGQYERRRSSSRERRRSSSRERQSSRDRQNERLGEPQGEASSYYGAGRDHQQQPYVGDSRYVNHAAGQQGSQQQHGSQQQYGQQQQHDSQQQYGQQQHGNEPPQYQQYPSTATHSSNSGRESHNQGYQNSYDGPGDAEGERGIMGGIAGGAAGAYGGHTVGGKSGHGTSGTIVGALVGAFAGSKGEDKISDWKDERDDKKKHEQDQKHQSEQRHDGGPRSGGNYSGNFSATSKDIRIDAHGDFTLHAECRKPDGSYHSSSLPLNSLLDNNGGSFNWAQKHTSSARTVTVIQGDTLRAIAARHNCGFEQLAQHNGIQNPDLIHPGQVLQLPAGGGTGNFGASARDVRLVDGGQKLEAELQRGGDWVRASIVLDERIGNKNGCLEYV